MKQIAITIELSDERATQTFGERLGQLAGLGTVVYLYGELGSGKTTFVRGFLKGKGYFGRVKSPTYTIVESYDKAQLPIHHFDLYRFKDPEEIEYLGIRDYLYGNNIILIEWPEKGKGYLPNPTLKLTLEIIDRGRKVHLAAANLLGQEIIDKYENQKA